jgi:hypothetical protein
LVTHIQALFNKPALMHIPEAVIQVYAILSQAQSLPEGGMFSPKEFLHLGSRGAIDQTLSRLAREGSVRLVVLLLPLTEN